MAAVTQSDIERPSILGPDRADQPADAVGTQLSLAPGIAAPRRRLVPPPQERAVLGGRGDGVTRGGRETLDEVLAGAWSELVVAPVTACPVCAGRMTRRPVGRDGGAVAGGWCEDCRSVLG